MNGRRGQGAERTFTVPRPYTATQSTANTEPDLLPDADVLEGLSPSILRAISPTSKPPSTKSPVRVKNFKYIGSYNWLDGPRPTIIVPGAPPTWRDRALPFHVPFDEGFQIFDPNGYHMGSSSSSPLLPIFRAVDVVAEDNADTTMDWPAVDIVTDRSTLRKLLRWVAYSNVNLNHPSATWNGLAQKYQDFRIDLQLGGAKTVLMLRWDTRTCQYIHPSAGCRVNFEKVATVPTQGCTSSSDHNRIVQYDLEGLRMVVRYEVDTSIFTSANEVDDLSDALAGLALSCHTPAPHPQPPSVCDHESESDYIVTVIRGGIQIPQSDTAEITTRSTKSANTHKWGETFTQLFLSQTPHHFLAIHQRGTFERVVKRTLAAPELRHAAADEAIQHDLKQLVCVLRDIQKLVQEHGRRGRLSLVSRGGRLDLYERSYDNNVGCLPDSELTRFEI